MVDMKAKPFNLSDEDCKWVEDTIAGMDIDEKIGQLFFNMGSSRTEDYLKMTVNDYHIGGIRYNPGTADEIYEQNRILQENSKIPLIIACNTENGGNGACTDGTPIGSQTKIGATRNADYAYQLGYMANKEAAAIGCNLSFAPVSDILYNWENPAKSVNDMSCEEWDETFGLVYRTLIDNGLEAIMAGHIMQPAYARHFNPDITDDEMMPATLSPELIQGLLREKLGFNGMVLTDASHMVGLTCRMKRSDVLPAAIAAGVDMFLFFNEMDEDFASMKQGYLDGRITEERLDDALHRILALKAHMGLHKRAKTELMPPRDQVHEIVGCKAHVAMQKEIADKSITLVKYKDKDVLPVTPERYKRIMIVYVKGLSAPGLGALFGAKKSPAEMLRDKLADKGFDAFIYESPIEKMQKQIQAGEKPDINMYFAGKTPISRKGGGEIPWYVFELPVVVIGVQHPFVLADIPQARTYINTYDSNESTLDALVAKLMAGEGAFTGEDPVDSFCGIFDTRI